MPEYPVRKMLACSLAAVLMTITGAAAAHAGEADLYLVGEYVNWKEYDTDGVTRLLKEDGPLYGIGYAYHGRVPFGGDDYSYDEPGGAALTLTPRIELFGGKLDYDGQACDLLGTCVAAVTETGIGGGKLEFDLGISDGQAFRLEIFIGAGVRGWLRAIKDNPDNAGGPVTGYAERWISSYGRMGLRAEFLFHETSRFFFETTVKRPFTNEEKIFLTDIDDNLDDVTVNPGEESSVFQEVGFKLGTFKISAFRETLVFSESPHVLKYSAYLGTTLEIWQPKSEAKIYGMRMGAAF